MRLRTILQFSSEERKMPKARAGFNNALKKISTSALSKVKEVAQAKPAALPLPKGSGGRKPSKARLKK